MKLLLPVLIAVQIVLVGLGLLSLIEPDTARTMRSFAAYYDNPTKETEDAYQASVKRDHLEANIVRGTVLVLLLVNSFGIHRVNRRRKRNLKT